MNARLLLCGLLVVAPCSAQTVKTILQSGPVGNRYDIVILGDGYQASEEAKFDADAQAAISVLFAKRSYGTYQSYFNVHTVFRASQQSGADHPDENPPIFVNTAYDASYNYGGTARCLYIGDTALATADSMLAPDVEGRVIVLVNDTRYGGCAGSFSVSYTGSSGAEVQSHEFGHSFGGLADEYDYGSPGTYSGSEPSQANITANSAGTKWSLWLGFNGISTFQGAGYYAAGLWRPKFDCLMRTLFVPLCEVCEEQIVKNGYATVSSVETMTPSSPVALSKPSVQTFSFTNLVPGPSSVSWLVDGNQVQSGGTSFQLDSTTVASGAHTVTVKVTDLTTFVRKDPQNRLTSTGAWNVNVSSSNPGTYTTFGAACLGSAFPLPPTLSATGAPEIGTTFTIRVSLAKQNSTGVLAFGASKTQWGQVPLPFSMAQFGAPQCAINVSLDVLLPLTTNSTGQANVPLALPNSPQLIGASFHNQALVLDPTANPFGYSFTNGATATLGQ